MGALVLRPLWNRPRPMNGPLNAENLAAEIAENRVCIEPGYLEYLRGHGHNIETLNEAHTVKRKDSETAHLVLNVTVTTKPTTASDFDAVADKTDLWCCDCWSWRSSSADIANGEDISSCGTCPHVTAVSKVEKANADPQQDTL